MALSQRIVVSGKADITIGGVVITENDHAVELDAYIKVERVSGSKDLIDATVSFRDGEKYFEKAYAFQPAMDGNNFIRQSYLHLKTLPEFADAVDV